MENKISTLPESLDILIFQVRMQSFTTHFVRVTPDPVEAVTGVGFLSHVKFVVEALLDLSRL